METPTYKQATYCGYVYKIKRNDKPDRIADFRGAVYNHRNHVFYIRECNSFREMERDFKQFIRSVYNRDVAEDYLINYKINRRETK